jgi:hypothetical protein
MPDLTNLQSKIGQILAEAEGPTKRLTNVDMKLFIDRDASVTDTMTMIRVLQSVAVVGQLDHSLRSKMGRTVLPISVKFLPGPGDIYENILKLSRAIKKAANVRVIKIVSLNDHPYLHNGKPMVL